jgi:hypothetical protein
LVEGEEGWEEERRRGERRVVGVQEEVRNRGIRQRSAW